MPSKKKTPTNFFPAKLHNLLENAERRGYANIVSWQEGGNSFRVWNPEVFVATIMPKYFKQTKLKSFQRQLNIYGWKRIGTGKNRGGYFHPSFVQGIPELCMLLKRAPVPDGKQNDDDEKSCTPAPIGLMESMPSERNRLNEGSNMALFGMDQMFPLKNPLFGNLNTIPKEAFQLQKEVNCQPASTSSTYMDPFGVGGTDSFCHTNYTDRNTAPRALIGGSGKMSEDMHLFADIFSQRDFIDEFRPDARAMGIMMPREMFDDGFPQKNQGDSSNQVT